MFQFISCMLRRSLRRDTQTIAIPAAFVAGFTFCFYRSNTIALYVMWKSLQVRILHFHTELIHTRKVSTIFFAIKMSRFCTWLEEITRWYRKFLMRVYFFTVYPPRFYSKLRYLNPKICVLRTGTFCIICPAEGRNFELLPINIYRF